MRKKGSGKALELWFSEDFSGGSRFGARVEQVLASHRSEFQQIDILETEAFGRMLVIDGKVQACELDEFVYHEMLTHPALLSHPAPARILVAGGGDGGTVRECLMHPEVREVTLVEIDRRVIELCQQYIPRLASSLDDDPRVTVRAADAAEVIRAARDMDVILVDSSDPVGPSEALFQPEFFEEIHAALAPNGITCLQAGSPFLGLRQVAQMVVDLKKFFPVVHLMTIPVPTYPGGTWCLALASKSDHNPRGDGGLTLRSRFEARGLDGKTRYLTSGMLGPCFEVPPFLLREIHAYLAASRELAATPA
jgi:spermidine synthase